MDYAKEFDGLLLDESNSDGELLSIARDYIAELQNRLKSGTKWAAYLEYLSRWVCDHASMNSYGMSPACFDEWEDNEGKED